MDYKDALAACLDAVRAGQDSERAIAAHPEHTLRLREDLTLAAAVHAYSMTHARPSEAAAARTRQRLDGELASLRSQRSDVPAPRPRFLWRPASLRGLGFSAAVVAAIGILVLTVGIFSDAPTAEAGTIEGVVVERTDVGLVLQTGDGIQDVSLDQASAITDESGANVAATTIEAGQVVVVRVKRKDTGALRAIAVQRRPAASLSEWCRLHPLRCQEVEPRLPRESLGCKPACAALPTPVASVGAERARLQELSERCQRIGGEACEELRRFCRANPGVCVVLAGWLRTLLELPDDARERIRVHTQRCQSGSILDCRELRLLCERLDQPCHSLTPVRPAPASTPRRPLN